MKSSPPLQQYPLLSAIALYAILQFPPLLLAENCPPLHTPNTPAGPSAPSPHPSVPTPRTDAPERAVQSGLDRAKTVDGKPTAPAPATGGGGPGNLDLHKEISRPAQSSMYSPNVIQQCALDSEWSYKELAGHTRKIAKGYRDLAKGARDHAKTLSQPENKESREKDAREWDKIADDYDKQAGNEDKRADEARQRAEKAAQEERQRKAEAERQQREISERARARAEEKARAEQAERDARKAKFEKELKDKADKAATEKAEARREAQRRFQEEMKELDRQEQARIDARKADFKASGKLAEKTGGRVGTKGKKENDVTSFGDVMKEDGVEIGVKGATTIGTARMDKGIGGAIGGAVDGAFTVKDVVKFGKTAQEVVDGGKAQRQEVSDNIDRFSDPNWKPKFGEKATSGSIYWEPMKKNAAKLVADAPLPKF